MAKIDFAFDHGFRSVADPATKSSSSTSSNSTIPHKPGTTAPELAAKTEQNGNA